MNQKIYKIVIVDEWRKAEEAGFFDGSAIDVRDGFIHFSAAHQVRGTAERYFRGQKGLLLVAVDTAALGGALKWEKSRGGEDFPHLYGALPMSAIVSTTPMTLGSDEQHLFPDEIP